MFQPPVLPTPSSITYNNQPLLKRPGSGRPRGRPPLPKVPGQVRQPRGRSPNVSSGNYNWQKALIEQNATYNTYNYLKAYQDELIKQYSQSLNIAQLTQLSQYFSQATAFAQSQILASQNPLLSAQNVLKQPFVSPATDSNKVNAYKKQQDQMTAVMEAMKKYTLPGKTANVKKSSAAITQPSVTSHTKTPKLSAVVSSSSISSFPAPKIPKDTTLTHLAASLNQVTSPKSKSIYTPVTYKNTFMGAMSHPAIETKLCSGTSSTKTTSNSQVFKEPSLAKHPTLLQKNVDQAATILMKERPNISITPVLPTPGSLTTTTSFTPALSTTGKTLQEKLADKQKQLSSKQLGRNIEAEIVTAPVKKTLNIPSIPSSLSVSKATPSAMALPKFTIESGISISQVLFSRLGTIYSSSSFILFYYYLRHIFIIFLTPRVRQFQQNKSKFGNRLYRSVSKSSTYLFNNGKRSILCFGHIVGKKKHFNTFTSSVFMFCLILNSVLTCFISL